MALRAFATLQNMYNNAGNDALFDVNIVTVVLGPNWGNMVEPRCGQNLQGFDPTSLTLADDIGAAIKADLIATYEVPFGTLDTDTVKVI